MACPDRDLDPRVGGDEFLEHLGEHVCADRRGGGDHEVAGRGGHHLLEGIAPVDQGAERAFGEDRKSTRLNSSHSSISYAVFCLKKKKKKRKKETRKKQKNTDNIT